MSVTVGIRERCASQMVVRFTDPGGRAGTVSRGANGGDTSDPVTARDKP